ncbi:hypothetical protein [Streptomyces sp. NPDC018352]|uniref:hypothetical protein n=1 Tax=Streptomyces sp. NPDC018352 TaxID=3157194 RepID=UPI0033D279E5
MAQTPVRVRGRVAGAPLLAGDPLQQRGRLLGLLPGTVPRPSHRFGTAGAYTNCARKVCRWRVPVSMVIL